MSAANPLPTKEELHSRATMAAVAWLMAESNGRHDPRSMHDIVKGVFTEHIDKWRAARFPELAAYVAPAQPVQQPAPELFSEILAREMREGTAVFVSAAPVAAPVAGQEPVVDVLPCPFCGSAPEFSAVYDPDERRYMAMDIECCAKMTATVSYPSCFEMSTDDLTRELKSRAKAAWNERAAPVPAASVHDKQEQGYIGTRLRRVAKAAGVTVDYGDDEFYYAGAFSILGDIARALDKPAASVQPDDECQACKGSSVFGMVRGIRCANCNGTTVVQPDSGRDAALVKFFDALRQIDFHQFNANREPCWNIHEDGRFCGRAKSWAGHECGYKYVSMTDAIKAALAAHPANVAQPVGDATLVDEADLECQIPPLGWRCTRGAGHSGPCAAVECPEDIEAVKRGMERLAAHPANVAQPVSDAALVAATSALAWKWHRDAVKDGFACSEPAQELFEVLGWPDDPAMSAPAKTDKA